MAKLGTYPAASALGGTEELIGVQTAISVKITPDDLRAYVYTKVNLSAIVAPTVNDDSSIGYAVGSKWVNTVLDVVYFCVDSTVGAAVWIPIAFTDNIFRISDDIDTSKKIAFDASGIAAATTRTVTMPNEAVDLTKVNREIFTLSVAVVANQDYVLWNDAPFNGTITLIRTKSVSGTCTLTGKIITTPLGGTVNSVSSSAQEQTHVTANTFVKGDEVLFTITSNATCLDMSVAFYITY